MSIAKDTMRNTNLCINNQLKNTQEIMTVFVKKIQNNNRKMEKAYGKYYGHAVIIDEVGIEELASEIQENCTAKRADVLAVLSELGPTVTKMIQKSLKVRIPYLGTFKMSVKSEGVEKPEDYDVRQHIRSVRVLFRPEYTIEQGHAVKEMTRGVKIAELPKNLTAIPDSDDSGNPDDGFIEDQP